MTRHHSMGSTATSTATGVRQSDDETELSNEATCGLGKLQIKHPAGIFPVRRLQALPPYGQLERTDDFFQAWGSTGEQERESSPSPLRESKP